MPTIDEILNAADESTPVCIINPDTREIKLPYEYKLFGVESDEKVNRIYFSCPRIVGDNIDLTTLNLYINYSNAKDELNVYHIDDVSVSGDNIIFSWLLSRNVTRYAGTVKFIVCAKKSDSDDILNEWNTRIANGTVEVGLEAVETLEDANPDIFDQIITKLEEAKKYLHTHDNKEILDSITKESIEKWNSISNAVSYDKQLLTEEQKSQARSNIGASEELQDDEIIACLNESGIITILVDQNGNTLVDSNNSILYYI